jgi:heptosyltransferase II
VVASWPIFLSLPFFCRAMRVGVFLPNWIGDVVMATPAIRALREHIGAGGQLIGIMRPYVTEVLAGLNWLDEQIHYDKQSSRMSFADRDSYERLRAARLDCVVLLTNSLRTAWMAWRSGARQRIGYVGDARSLFLTKRLARPSKKFNSTTVPTIDGYLRVAEAAGCRTMSRRLKLATTPDDELAADEVWHDLGLPPGEQVIVLNSGGAYGAAKHWPAEYFAELARRIVRSGEFSVLVNCGPAERKIAETIARLAADPRVVSLAHSELLPIGLTKACVRRSRLVVSTDSGPRFFGIAFGKPVISLFGPTDPAATRTLYEHETCLSLRLECQPCMARTCPLGHHRCLRELPVDSVYAAVMHRLDRCTVEANSRMAMLTSPQSKIDARAVVE